MLKHVAIVGGGFSGTLQAINLLRHEGPRATLVERGPEAGLGVAYGAADEQHLLNVRAANMSALPDDPSHFVRWLETSGRPEGSGDFVPRPVYGRYLRDLLAETQSREPGRLEILRGDVDALEIGSGEASLTLADGRLISADAAVLAVGNLPPHHPGGFSAVLPRDVYAGDPWHQQASAGLGDGDTVLVLGTGLTMVDMVLKLEAEGYRGRIVALSRRGLMPNAHALQDAFESIDTRPAPEPVALLRAVRQRAEEVGWRNAVDELRPFTVSLWRAADAPTRARFLRHLRPWWDVHRHRIAPSVSARLRSLVESGRMEVVAAKTCRVGAVEGGIEVDYRPRGTDTIVTRRFRRAINCTGPQSDLLASEEPLLRKLVDEGRIRPDPLRIGIDVDSESRVIAADGSAGDRLFAIGPMTRGASWEIVAVPDIRKQVWSLARHMANAHWVGGEGL